MRNGNIVFCCALSRACVLGGRMTTRKLAFFGLLLAGLALQACAPADVSGLVATGIAGTQQADALLAAAAEANLPTATPVTAEPTQAPTLEPTAQPTVV